MNSNYTTERKSTEELKQQVLQDIKKVKEDFDEIKQRMTPGQLIDDAIFYRHDRNPAAVFEHLKSNPVGTSLLTVGTLLLMENENHQSYESMAKEKAHVVKDKFGNVIHTAQDKIHNVQDKAAHMKDSLKSKVSKSREKEMPVSVGFGEGMDLEGTTEKVSGKFQSVVESAKHLDPLTYLALGAGLGTITGAALPVSEAESNLIDSKFENSLSNFSSELEDALNESVNILKNEFIGGFTEINMHIF